MDYTIEKSDRRESFSEGGIVYLDISFKGLRICEAGKAQEKINGFYEKILEGCYEYARTALFARSKSEYAASQDEKKRFSFRPYRYSVLINYIWQNEEFISISCAISLQKRGSERYEKIISQTWDKKRATLIPLSRLGVKVSSRIKRALKEKEKQLNLFKINRKSFCLKNGSVLFFSNERKSGKSRSIDIPIVEVEKANKS